MIANQLRERVSSHVHVGSNPIVRACVLFFCIYSLIAELVVSIHVVGVQFPVGAPVNVLLLMVSANRFEDLILKRVNNNRRYGNNVLNIKEKII